MDGIITLESHKGSVNAEVLADFIRGNLDPQMWAFDGESPTSVVVMDNCSLHHTELVKEARIVVIFLPPYSPDYNPIELVFAYIKAYLKHHDELLQALSDPLPVIKLPNSVKLGLLMLDTCR